MGGSCLEQGAAHFAVEPRVLHVGQHITGTVTPGGNDEHWDWKAFVKQVGGGKVVSGCGDDVSSCTVKASHKAVSNVWEVFGEGVDIPFLGSRATSISSDYFIVNNDLAQLSGTVSAGPHKPLSGVELRVSGTSESGHHVSRTTTTDSSGNYAFALTKGSYTVRPLHGTYKPPERSVNLSSNRTGVDFEQGHDQIKLTIDPQTVESNGRAVVTVTATDTDAEGNPIPDHELQIEPPPTYDVPGLFCDASARFVSPTRLGSGEILPTHFNRFTDQDGQVRFTVFVGAVPGDMIIEAREADHPLVADSKVLTVGVTGAGATLPFDLPATLLGQGDTTLFAGGEASLLHWLGTIKAEGALGGIGFMPIHATDATAAHRVHDGVVLFPENQGVKQQLFSFLDGGTNSAPGEQQAQVIDIDNLLNWQFGQAAAGHLGHSIQNHLQSLQGWQDGEVVDFGENARGQDRKLSIPGRGRPFSGFAHPQGNDYLLYEYGPYPPFGSDQQTANTFDRCISPGFQGTTFTVHSPLAVVVHDSRGDSAGVSPHGGPGDTLPGSVVVYSGKRVRSVSVPTGTYTVSVAGTGKGPATLVVSSGKKTEVFSFQAHKGQTGSLSIKPGHLPKSLRIGGHTVTAAGGLKLRVKGLPASLAHGKARTLKLTVRDQFGQPASGVELNLTGPPGVGGRAATSDRNGNIKLTVRPSKPGQATVHLSGVGYLKLTRKLTIT